MINSFISLEAVINSSSRCWNNLLVSSTMDWTRVPYRALSVVAPLTVGNGSVSSSSAFISSMSAWVGGV